MGMTPLFIFVKMKEIRNFWAQLSNFVNELDITNCNTFQNFQTIEYRAIYKGEQNIQRVYNTLLMSQSHKILLARTYSIHYCRNQSVTREFQNVIKSQKIEFSEQK